VSVELVEEAVADDEHPGRTGQGGVAAVFNRRGIAQPHRDGLALLRRDRDDAPGRIESELRQDQRLVVRPFQDALGRQRVQLGQRPADQRFIRLALEGTGEVPQTVVEDERDLAVW